MTITFQVILTMNIGECCHISGETLQVFVSYLKALVTKFSQKQTRPVSQLHKGKY